nr:type I toxin-antitoxin system Ibs family toxin [Escherichia coli]
MILVVLLLVSFQAY